MKDIEEIITKAQYEIQVTKQNVKSKATVLYKYLSKFIGQETDVINATIKAPSSKNILIFINDELFVAFNTNGVSVTLDGHIWAELVKLKIPIDTYIAQDEIKAFHEVASSLTLELQILSYDIETSDQWDNLRHSAVKGNRL